MSWWMVPVIGVMGVVGLLIGWTIGSFLIAFRNEPLDVWEDWED